jgi:hypothetical protein
MYYVQHTGVLGNDVSGETAILQFFLLRNKDDSIVKLMHQNYFGAPKIN